MARAWSQKWDNGATSFHRNRDDVVEFSRYFNTKHPTARRLGSPEQVFLDDVRFYDRIVVSPRGIWGP